MKKITLLLILLQSVFFYSQTLEGTWKLSPQAGAFAVGPAQGNYTFQTIGTDVKITFQLLESKVGLVAFLRKQSPLTETQMAAVIGQTQTFTQTITGQTIGSTITFAVKFAFAGGFSVTRYISYVVGNNCALEVASIQEPVEFSFINPVEDFININSEAEINKVEVYNMTGILVLESKSDTQKIDITNLSQGIYLLAVYSGDNKSVKKMIVK